MFKGLSMLLLSVASIGAFATPTAKDDIEINPLKAASGDEVVYKMDFDYKGSYQELTPSLYLENVMDFKDRDKLLIEEGALFNSFVDPMYSHGICLKPTYNYAYTAFMTIKLANPDQLISYAEFDLINSSDMEGSLFIDGTELTVGSKETELITQFVYKDSIYINTVANDFIINNIKFHVINKADIKANYVSNFIKMTNDECANYDKPNAGISDKTWNMLALGFDTFSAYDSEQAFEIMSAVPNAQGDELGQMMARYVMICNKYNKDNFLGSDFVSKSLQPHTYLDYTNIVIVSFSGIVLIAVVSFAIIKANKVKKAR